MHSSLVSFNIKSSIYKKQTRKGNIESVKKFIPPWLFKQFLKFIISKRSMFYIAI